jgi:hypothetical protein
MELCSQCAICSDNGFVCGGQGGIYFPEACPSHEHYVGNGRWE